MSVSASFRTFVLEQLGRTTTSVRDRAMFGGVGIYSGDLFFALIAEDTVYFKVDAENRGDFAARGMAQFRPFGEAGDGMQYYALPEDVLEDPEVLQRWVDGALAAARRKKSPGTRKRGG